ncbi:hypothetical protein MSTE_02476 [Mycobacteroides stephanolepidis]|jgi:hypothetical protein|uniref:Uncharacterized protein n=1 Tax=[Mycobacterium] stephanolepidis TaxID=1520670 RepID=A0A1Z4EXX2_9MYCO|nr:hypothetical protein [Mycobacteroides chelonae]AMW20057.1 hypothetical protein Chelonae_p2306 [Mycobacterium sp. QIA-37]BAX97787.1 hypothetical protein MSTE_02476 [[Mycobacterium] stephanolepidis]SKN74826.1 Uncharacterised protein [Mycobacteroides abscessus subsp. bolletii]
MKWFSRRRSEDREPVPLSAEAASVVDQLVDHHHDREWPTAIGWHLPDEEPPWEALHELRSTGYCEVERDGDEVEVDFTELGRRTFT